MKIYTDNEICITVSYKKIRVIKSRIRCFLRTSLMQNSANTHLKKVDFGVVSVNFSEEIISSRRSFAFFLIKKLFTVLRIPLCVGVQLFRFQFILKIFVIFGISWFDRRPAVALFLMMRTDVKSTNRRSDGWYIF